MADIDFDALRRQVLILVHDTLSEYGKEVKDEAIKFVDETKDKIIKWITLFVGGELTRSELFWLLNSQIEVMKLEGLKELGTSEIKLDIFKMKLVNTILTAALKIITL